MNPSISPSDREAFKDALLIALARKVADGVPGKISFAEADLQAMINGIEMDIRIEPGDNNTPVVTIELTSTPQQ